MDKNTTSSAIERIKERKKKRQQQARIRLIIFLLILVAAVALIWWGIAASKNKNQPTPPQATPASAQADIEASATPAPSDITPEASGAPSMDPSSEEENKVTASSAADPALENDLLKVISAASSEEKVCYLTFDDGPNNSVTLSILDTLRRFNAKATFFSVGSLIETNQDSARRIYEEGHLLANHSYAHNYSSLYATGDSFMSEINKTEGLIQGVMDEGDSVFKLIRFPGGSYNSGTYGAKKQDYKELLKQNGYFFADWNALSGDAEGKAKSVDQLLARVKETTAGKNQVVILMHDAAAKKHTAEALPSVMNYLAEQGYTFKRMDQF